MKTYILVHGAWHGGWCWEKIIPLLQQQGHQVLAPTLPGHEQVSNHSRAIHLSAYVEYIKMAVEKCDQPVILVGHSMAGVIISQVAEHIPHKIEQLIYISAFIPENGKALIDEQKQAIFPGIASQVVTDLRKQQLLLPLHNPERIRRFFYNCCTQEEAAYALSRLCPQPLYPFIEPLCVSAENFGRVPKIYIECLKDKVISIEDQRRMHQRVHCVVASLDTDHSPFFLVLFL